MEFVLCKGDGFKMFFITRVPRTLALMLAGAAMSLSGLVKENVGEELSGRE